MANDDIPKLEVEAKDEAAKLSTSPVNSIVGDQSPARASIHTQNAEEHSGTDDNTNTNADDEESQYPSTITKVAVGIGLALVVFLVFHLAYEFLQFLILIV